jgi:acyl carrier protein
MPVTRDDVLDVVAKEALVERDKLTPEASLESLGIASLDIISIVFALEDRFGIVLEQTEFEGIQTVEALVQLILAKTTGSASASA